MKSIVVTGGSGRAGQAVIPELREAGYEVRNVDHALLKAMAIERFAAGASQDAAGPLRRQLLAGLP